MRQLNLRHLNLGSMLLGGAGRGPGDQRGAPRAGAAESPGWPGWPGHRFYQSTSPRPVIYLTKYIKFNVIE